MHLTFSGPLEFLEFSAGDVTYLNFDVTCDLRSRTSRNIVVLSRCVYVCVYLEHFVCKTERGDNLLS